MPENINSSLPEAETTPPLLQGIAQTRETLANLENTPLDAEGQEKARILFASFNAEAEQICQECAFGRQDVNNAVVQEKPHLKTLFSTPLDKADA